MSKQDEQVYLVRLTLGELREIGSVLRLAPRGEHITSAVKKFESVRPEHPKRREALEELARAYIEFQDGDYRPGGAQRLKERLDRAEAIFRSLEDK